MLTGAKETEKQPRDVKQTLAAGLSQQLVDHDVKLLRV